MRKAERHDQKRKEILDQMIRYRDANGNMDMTLFREENPLLYARISYYFGTIEGALQALNSELVPHLGAKGSPTNKLTLRNHLAYDMLMELRKEHTLEEIGRRYGGFSRAHVRQLLESLDMSVGAKRREESREKEFSD